MLRSGRIAQPVPCPDTPLRRAASRRRVCLRIPLLLVGTACALAAAASADTWSERYARGLDLEQRGAWEEALQEFRAALQAQPVPRYNVFLADRRLTVRYDPHFHMARCLVELERPREAFLHFSMARRARVTPPEQLLPLGRRLEEALRSGRTDEPAAPTPTAPSPLPTAVVPAAATARAGEATATVPAPTAPAPPAPPAPLAGESASTPVARSLVVPTPAVTPLRIPEARETRTRTLALAAAGCAVAGGLLWRRVRRVRRRRQLTAVTAVVPEVPTAATVVENTARLGNYRLGSVLGRGGMATTYRAVRERDGKEVALKVPHETCLAEPTFVARFLREGKLGEHLHHPRIVRILEAAEAQGRPFLAMELLAGRTLKQVLREEGPLPLHRALTIARDIAEALDYAHAKGVVHRDLKPENIMILADGSLKVMDLGIARVTGEATLTSSGFFLGTPLYAAPEMLDPKHIDHRVDLYALGIILFEMLEGTVPFSADSPFRVFEMHRHEPLPAPHTLPRPVPDVVWHLIEQLCAKDPDARLGSAQALLVELDRLLQQLPLAERSHG